MLVKRLAALAAACTVVLSCAFAVYADDTEHRDDSSQAQSESSSVSETDSSKPETVTTTTTTATTTSAATTTTTTTTTITTTTTTTTTAPPATTPAESSAATTKPTPVTEASRAVLEVGKIVDDVFTVDLRLIPSTSIAGAKIKVEYDSSVFSLIETKINSDAIGGIPTDSRADGVYTFTYLNTEGTVYSGAYSTLRFRVIDNAVPSSMIYVNVESLEDTNLFDVPCNVQNGMVRINTDNVSEADSDKEDTGDPEGEEERQHECRVKLRSQLVTLDELGVPDVLYVRSVKIANIQLAYYEKGALMLVEAGETEMVVNYMSGKELRFKLIIEPDEPAAPVMPSDSSVKERDNGKRNLFIAAVVMFAIAAIALEYMFIIKPFREKKRSAQAEKPEERFVEYDDDDAPDLVQDPEEVFARRVRPDETIGKQAVQKPNREGTSQKTARQDSRSREQHRPQRQNPNRNRK